ncbi:unnamed protein product, partial [Heterosigma akashiwo]
GRGGGGLEEGKDPTVCANLRRMGAGTSGARLPPARASSSRCAPSTSCGRTAASCRASCCRRAAPLGRPPAPS